MDKKCPCLTDTEACCGCVSMHCDECHKPMQSKYVQGRFCSNCGRPLKAELQSEFEELKKQNEALTINMNACGLAIMRMQEDKEALANKIFAELIHEAQTIADRYGKWADETPEYGYERIDYRGAQKGAVLVLLKIAELKKKYIGDQTDEKNVEKI